MLKFRTFSILLLLCMGVPWRCLNFDERTPVNAFFGLAGDSAAGLPAGVDCATTCGETLEVISVDISLGSAVDCSDTKIVSTCKRYFLLLLVWKVQWSNVQ